MSHIVTIRTEVRDPIAVAAACHRLGLPEPVHGTAKLYAGEATGLLVRLPGWTYPAVVHAETGGGLGDARDAVGRQPPTHLGEPDFAALQGVRPVRVGR